MHDFQDASRVVPRHIVHDNTGINLNVINMDHIISYHIWYYVQQKKKKKNMGKSKYIAADGSALKDSVLKMEHLHSCGSDLLILLNFQK